MAEAVEPKGQKARTPLPMQAKGKAPGRKCRCSLRHMSDPDRTKHGCPDRVFGQGPTRKRCQAAAKSTAPQACRKYYGHCGWLS